MRPSRPPRSPDTCGAYGQLLSVDRIRAARDRAVLNGGVSRPSTPRSVTLRTGRVTSLELAAVDFRLAQIDQRLLRRGIHIDDLLILVLVVEHRAVQLQTVVEPRGLEAAS